MGDHMLVIISYILQGGHLGRPLVTVFAVNPYRLYIIPSLFWVIIDEKD